MLAWLGVSVGICCYNCCLFTDILRMVITLTVVVCGLEVVFGLLVW